MERKEKMLVRSVGAKSPVSPKASQKEPDFYLLGNREPLRVLCRGRKLTVVTKIEQERWKGGVR